MLFRPNPSSGVPIYLQLMEQVKHAVETGVLRPGDQLPGIRALAEQLVVNPNTIAKAYRELQHEGVIDLRHGSGAFISQGDGVGRRPVLVRAVQPLVSGLIERLRARGLTDDEIRRLFDAELARAERAGRRSG
jgi:GntR family transcriptional regulator